MKTSRQILTTLFLFNIREPQKRIYAWVHFLGLGVAAHIHAPEGLT